LGWDIHDYLEYQPSREKVLAERAAAADRMRSVRTKFGGSSPERSPELREKFNDPVPGPGPEYVNAAAAAETPGPAPRARARDAPQPLGELLAPLQQRQQQQLNELPDEVRERLAQPPLGGAAC
jgi:hypothetical protein